MEMRCPIKPRLPRVAACAFSLCLLLPGWANSDDDESHTPTSSSSPNPQLAGIQTAVLQVSRQTPEIVAFATITDLTSLLNMRQQYLTSLAQANGAAAKFHESEQSLRRTQSLHQQDIVASKRLQEQQARWHADKADAASANLQKQALLANNRLQWGEQLSQWFLQPDERRIQGFLSGQQRLLSINLPDNQAPEAIWLEAQGRRQLATQAHLIGTAPQVDPLTLRQKAFYQLEHCNLPIGSQLTAWLPASGRVQVGVEFPESAVVWHQGQASVFIKTPPGTFERRTLQDFTSSYGGLILTSSLQAGDEIVTSGAQTLLSQELKAQIPSEDDD